MDNVAGYLGTVQWSPKTKTESRVKYYTWHAAAASGLRPHLLTMPRHVSDTASGRPLLEPSRAGSLASVTSYKSQGERGRDEKRRTSWYWMPQWHMNVFMFFSRESDTSNPYSSRSAFAVSAG